MSQDRTGGDLFLAALERYGVDHLFGNPGTTELPVMNALPDSDVEYVLAPHEDVAVGMAAGYASTLRHRADEIDGSPVGVVNLHVAPGLAHGLGNLYGAAVAGAPLVVTAGSHALDFRHEEPILDGDLVGMADQFTKWADEVSAVEALPTMLRRAFKVATTPPTGPVFLALPMDVMEATTDAAVEPLDDPVPAPGRPPAAAVARAADAIVDADSPALVVGDHVGRHRAWSADDPVAAAVELADAGGLRVHGEILSCEVNFPTDHDQWVSQIPPDEALARNLMATDALVFAGVSTNTTLMPHDDGPLVPDDATVINLGVDQHEIGKNHGGIDVLGDLGATMRELAALVGERLDEETKEERREDVAAMREFAAAKTRSMGEDEAPAGDDRPSKAELVDAMRAAVPDAYVVDEGVTAKYALLTRWEFAPGDLLSNKGGGLGYGLPATVGAALAEAERDEPRDVVGFVGDGSYLYYPHSVYPAARENLDLTVVVPDNRNYRILKDNTVARYGGTDDDHDYVGMDFDPPVDLAANAESHGAGGHTVAHRDEVEAAIREAVAEDGPSVVDVHVHD